MKDKKNVPKLRFPEFTGEWILKSVGEMTEEDSEYATLSSRLPLFTSSRSGLIYQNEYRSSQTTESKETLFSIVPYRHCTYRHMSDDDVFHLNINTLEKGLVSREYPVFHANESNRLDFFVQYMNSSEKFRAFCKGQKKGGTRTRLYYKALCEFKMLVPTIDEQNRVADFLGKYDTLITLQQRKLVQIKEYKKGMLQKMFPKEGETVPEVRFPGFSGEWEQRKLGILVSFSKGAGYSKGDLKEDGTPIILYGRLYTRYETVISEVDTFVDEKKGSVYSNGGEVIVPASGETAEDISIASVVAKPGILLGGDLNIITPSKDLDSAFLAISISNGKPHADMAKLAQGKSVVHLHNSDLSKIVLPYPSLDEQCRISKFFSNLDSLITLHQRKLEAMKEYKKGLLQQMFV